MTTARADHGRCRRCVAMRGIVKRFDRVVALDGVDLALARGRGPRGGGRERRRQDDAHAHPRGRPASRTRGSIAVRGPRGHRRRRRGRLPAGHRDGPPALHAVPVAHRGREPDPRPRAPAPRPVRPGRRRARRRRPRRRATASGSTPARASASCRWATSSGSRSCARSTAAPSCSSSTSRPAVLTPQEAEGLFRVDPRAPRRRAGPPCSSATSSTRCCAIADRDHGPARRPRHGHRGRRRDDAPAELARLMVGRELPPAPERRVAVERGAGAARSRACAGRASGASTSTVASGEIVGVAGVAGNGQSELAELIAGPAAGDGRLDPAARAATSPPPAVRERRDAGPRLHPRRPLPARARRRRVDRGQPDHGRPPPAAAGVAASGSTPRRRPALAQRSRRALRRSGRPSVDEPARSLSGGNAQRLVIARELEGERPLIVAAQPTRGIDIAATRFVHDELLARRDGGRRRSCSSAPT